MDKSKPDCLDAVWSLYSSPHIHGQYKHVRYINISMFKNLWDWWQVMKYLNISIIPTKDILWHQQKPLLSISYLFVLIWSNHSNYRNSSFWTASLSMNQVLWISHCLWSKPGLDHVELHVVMCMLAWHQKCSSRAKLFSFSTLKQSTAAYQMIWKIFEFVLNLSL